MVQHIRVEDSVFTPTGNAFDGTGPDSLLVDANAFLITSDMSGIGANLTGAWIVTINGTVGSFGGLGAGLFIDGGSAVSKVTINGTGDVFGANFGMNFSGAGTVTNKGSVGGFIAARFFLSGDVTFKNFGVVDSNSLGVQVAMSSSGIFTLANSGSITGGIEVLSSNAQMKITNSSLIEGDVSLEGAADTLTNSGRIRGTVDLGDGDDIFTNFVKVGKVVKSGTVERGLTFGVVASIDLGAGDDTLRGGKNIEIVRDDLGTDTYILGGGNDIFLADDNFTNSDNDGDDIVNAGSGIDTYHLDDADGIFIVNIDSIDHETAQGTILAQTAIEVFGQTDHIVAFENVTGGDAVDIIAGSGGANVLNGAGGDDHLYGFGGRDILTGGNGLDTFYFRNLSDSGVKASTRDVITDFGAGAGEIIDLSAIDANGNAAGEGIFDFIGFDQFSVTRGELREAIVKGITVISGDVNGDGKADFSIALKGHVLLDGADFNL